MSKSEKLLLACTKMDNAIEQGEIVHEIQKLAIADLFDDFFTTVKPTGYYKSYSPFGGYSVSYYINGERCTDKGMVHDIPNYTMASVVEMALTMAYNAGQQSKGGDDSVF